MMVIIDDDDRDDDDDDDDERRLSLCFSHIQKSRETRLEMQRVRSHHYHDDCW